mgnify:CR=1 FL=1
MSMTHRQATAAPFDAGQLAPHRHGRLPEEESHGRAAGAENVGKVAQFGRAPSMGGSVATAAPPFPICQ